ncbi:MAG: bis-aminopropyl spermidine synthase family protein [Candidatus Omnitrophica bacterium]|nr:bis-aminopropyl spermidine synthase family protein [Candidatus Omnitrophota bacterium]
MAMTPDFSLDNVCREVAEATRLEEGPPGVEALLRVVHREGPISPKEVARSLGVAIPIVSAIRRELERRGWLVRKGGMLLSNEGLPAASARWGAPASPCQEVPAQTIPPDEEAEGLGSEEEVEDESSPDLDYIPLKLSAESGNSASDPFLELLDEILEERPEADPRLDQSHATLETVLRRAELFLEHGWVTGKRVLFLGDDDLTSLVTLLVIRRDLGEEALRGCAAAVAEVDPRLVEFIQEIALGEDLPLAVVPTDLREPLPKPLTGAFDFFFTDPPYTPAGVRLFLERGCLALDPNGARKAALAVPVSPPSLQRATQEALLDLGFVVDFLDPGFNEYLGASMQGGVSALYGLSLVATEAGERTKFETSIYTAQARKRR